MRLRLLFFALLSLPGIAVFALAAISLSLSCYTYRYTVVNLTDGNVELSLLFNGRERVLLEAPPAVRVFDIDVDPYIEDLEVVAALSNRETLEAGFGYYVHTPDGLQYIWEIKEPVIVISEQRISFLQLRSVPFFGDG